ncbi:MAG: hypothetical protein IMY83_02025, partial [Chloroflexi bacterium]|nr:hypothetical protein [Chloroflexota bacterium]
MPEEAADNGVDPPLLSGAALTSGFSFQPSLSAASGSRRHPVLQSFTTHMDYFLGIDVGSVNAKLVLIDKGGVVVQSDTEKISSGPRAAVGSLIGRIREKIDSDSVVAVGVSGSGRSAIPKELGWIDYSSSLSVASGVLHYHPDARTIIQIGGQTSLVIELE